MVLKIAFVTLIFFFFLQTVNFCAQNLTNSMHSKSILPQVGQHCRDPSNIRKLLRVLIKHLFHTIIV